jgi:hypothetical protein
MQFLFGKYYRGLMQSRPDGEELNTELVTHTMRVGRFLRVFGLVFAGLLLGSGNAVRAGDETNSPAGLAIYSDINFIEVEGEFVGLQVGIVPYRDGQKVLWRSAGSFLNPPLLLDIAKLGNTLKVVVPDGDPFTGVWKLNLKGNFLYAVGPDGQKYNLKRIGLK